MIYLDTNFYSALANGHMEAIEVLEGEHELALPLPVIAELRYGFIKGSKQAENEKNLQRFLAQSNVTVMIPDLETTLLYAELQLHCLKNAEILSHNDLWIAALAKQGDGILVSYDQDFFALKGLMDKQLLILESA